MAERRMFAKTIIDSDAFIDMPVTARLLYYDLAMRADDDGFINSPKKIMRMIGASEDDLRILGIRKFIIPFENGVVVIKHWKIHNYIRKDTYNETTYKEQKAQLSLDENNAYTLRQRAVDEPSTECIRNVYESLTQDRIGKDRLGEDRIGKDRLGENTLLDGCMSQTQTIVKYLNEQAHKNYRCTQKTRQLVHARMEEGFTVDDFKTVIDKKTQEWLGSEDWERFLRPETLFGTKFEGYLNAPLRKPERLTENTSKDTIDRLWEFEASDEPDDLPFM